MKKLLSLLLGVCLYFNSQASTTVITKDADYYLYFGTYNALRTPLFVGVHDVQVGSPYRYHFNFGNIEIGSISTFNSGDTGLLKLNLQRFRVPGIVDPGYQGPPTYTFATSGITFSLKVIALTTNFLSIEESSDPINWYLENIYNKPAIDEVTFSSAGEIQFNITSALIQWRDNPELNYGLGLIGTYSSLPGTTAQFYSLESADSGLHPSVHIIPEPTVFEYIILISFVLLVVYWFKR